MAASVVGRDAELATLGGFLAAIPGGARALVLEGDAGMGKTTLWRACVELARAEGLRVLEAAPAQSEGELSFAGLGDLLDPVLDAALGPLPGGQRAALSRALVLDEVEGPPPDAHAVGVALLGALRALVEGGPLLLAIDDVQWLDPASAAALAFAGRRLRSEPIAIVLARRSGLASALADELRRSLGDGASTLEVGPLDAAALHLVVSDRLGATLPRPLLVEVQQASGGNPFYAIEIVRTLQRRGAQVEAGQPLPLPESLHDLVDQRLATLPDESLRFLLAVAAHAHPTVTITEAASGVSVPAGLEPALAAGIVELDGARVRFTHPLLAAGVLEAANPRHRAEVHARLAELLEDPEARAWQLAACRVEPDEEVAVALEAAAARARTRGAPRPAALLLDRAAELTPTRLPEARVRRAVDAAYLHFESGDSHRAKAQLRDVIGPLPAGALRAEALVVLARIQLYEAPDEARELFEQVIDEAEGGRRILLLAHEGAAACNLWMYERLAESLAHSDVASSLASELADDVLAGDAVMTRLSTETLLGRPTAAATLEEALALQHAATRVRVLDQPLVSVVETWSWLDEHERSRQALDDLMERARDLGDENARPWLLCLHAVNRGALGYLEVAREYASEAAEAAQQSGQPLFAGIALALEALACAQLGLVDETLEAVARVRASARDRFSWLTSCAAAGHVELSRGAAAAAVLALEPAEAFARSEGIVEPGATRFVTDLVEASIELGRLEEARTLLDWYEGNALRLERASGLASSARCRGLLAAQAGDLDAAVVAFERALGWHARVELPLDRARTLLALGVAQRRMKQRRQARETLEAAVRVFEEIGAALWAVRARAELKRISGRAATPGALTPAEERVATLVAEGKTNKEVAAALFLSDRTVEGHLARVFGKLGIGHRGELAAALQRRGIGASNTGDSTVSAESPAS